jgi:integration host factor subunit beta
MMKSELIEILAREQSHLAYKDVELAVRCILEQMSAALASGERIEIRGFGSFSLHFRPPRVGRNPKTGDAVSLSGKHVPHFKPGKELRDRVNQAYQAELVRREQQAGDTEEGKEEAAESAESSHAAVS